MPHQRNETISSICSECRYSSPQRSNALTLPVNKPPQTAEYRQKPRNFETSRGIPPQERGISPDGAVNPPRGAVRCKIGAANPKVGAVNSIYGAVARGIATVKPVHGPEYRSDPLIICPTPNSPGSRFKSGNACTYGTTSSCRVAIGT